MQLVLALVASAAALAPRTAMDRRTAFKVGTGAAALPFVPAAVQAKGSKKVVVVGTGFVASYVARDLAKAGASVTTVSRSSPDAQRAKVAKFVGALPDKAVTYVSADAATADLSAVFKGADAVVSCVGVVPGGKNQLAGNGAVNVAIADAAAKSKVPKMVRKRPKPCKPALHSFVGHRLRRARRRRAGLRQRRERDLRRSGQVHLRCDAAFFCAFPHPRSRPQATT